MHCMLCRVLSATCTASTSFVFVALLNKQQIVNCDRANNYGRPELFVSDFSARAARFGR